MSLILLSNRIGHFLGVFFYRAWVRLCSLLWPMLWISFIYWSYRHERALKMCDLVETVSAEKQMMSGVFVLKPSFIYFSFYLLVLYCSNLSLFWYKTKIYSDEFYSNKLITLDQRWCNTSSLAENNKAMNTQIKIKCIISYQQ